MNFGSSKESLKERIFSKRKKINKALYAAAAYKALFLSESGKVVLEDLASKCFVFCPVTDVSNQNGFSMVSAFNDGKRAAFLDILKMIGISQDKMIEMLKNLGDENDD